MIRLIVLSLVVALTFPLFAEEAATDGPLHELQAEAIREGRSSVAHWGPDPDNYTAWGNHSNRLIPIYTFGTRGGGQGVDLTGYIGENSPYRSEEAVRRIYGFVPTNTVNPDAEYCDQTNLFDLQQAAAAAGRKHIFLVIFDGMDWQTTRAAAIYNASARETGTGSGRTQEARPADRSSSRPVPVPVYRGGEATKRGQAPAGDQGRSSGQCSETPAEASPLFVAGRGSGLHFLDYTADETTQFGWMVVAPHNAGTVVDPDRQDVRNPGGLLRGGYNAAKGGPNPWTPGDDVLYLIGRSQAGVGEHPIPDSAATATAMTSGVKTYNEAISVDASGNRVPTIAHILQEQGWQVGAVSSVPISHATPAAAYAHNVTRNDYQDLTRDMLGLPSVSHPERPLPGLDVVIGGGWGVVRDQDAAQGENFVPGNRYLTDADLQSIDVAHGGKYAVAQRTAGEKGGERLLATAREAAEKGTRLLGFYGLSKYNGHLPYRTASGNYRPAPGRQGAAETYTQADIDENPTLAEMTAAAIEVLGRGDKGFWLMVEPGDVDWANHDNNLDNSIGAVLSGDAAVKVITAWVERHSNWDESLLIVTADHGHYLFLLEPERLVP